MEAGISNSSIVDDLELVKRIPLSLAFVRADRRGKRLLPYYKVGTRVLYDLGRVREALQALEVGGVAPKSRGGRR